MVLKAMKWCPGSNTVQAPMPVSTPAHPSPARGGRSALVIDDDEMVRSVLARGLQEAGVTVGLASTGRKGLAMYRRAPTDVVIVDLILPDIDGIDVLLDLDRDYPGLKAIAITGGSGDADFLDLAQKFGAMGILRKPFRIEELLALVEEVMEIERQQGYSSNKRRLHPRFPAHLPVAFAGEHTQGGGVAVNLSLDGCVVESPVLLQPDTALTLYLTVPNHPLPLCVDMATVAWRSHHQVGIQFIWMEQPAKDVLKETLRHLVT